MTSSVRTITAQRIRNLYIYFLKKLLALASGANKFDHTRELTSAPAALCLYNAQYSEVFSALKDLERSVPRLPILFPDYLLGIIRSIHMMTR